MGKKDKRNVGVVVDDDMEEENELEAELQAVLAMRQEKAMLSQDDSADAPPSKVKPSTYNKDGLLKALEELACTTLPFVETLQICDFPVEITDENDDLAREGRALMQSHGIQTKRPPDYFCENVKSDAHMTRIKDKLILEEKKIDAFEKRKQREVNRKYQKEVANMQKQEKSLKDKDKSRRGDRDNDDEDEDRRPAKRGRTEPGGGKSKKRVAMDKKYGRGVKEAMRSKLTDKKSLNDLSDFNPRGGKFVRREKAFTPGRGGKGGQGGGPGGRGGKGGQGGGPGGRGGKGAPGGKGAKKPHRAGKDARAKRRAASSSSS